MTESNLREEMFVSFQVTGEDEGWHSRRELQTETVEEHCFLACLGLLSYLSYIAPVWHGTQWG